MCACVRARLLQSDPTEAVGSGSLRTITCQVLLSMGFSRQEY